MLYVITDRYKIVQNHEEFAFDDELLGESVLHNGRKVWLPAKLPENYITAGNRISPYMVFSNSHDASGSIKVATPPVRIVCQTLCVMPCTMPNAYMRRFIPAIFLITNTSNSNGIYFSHWTRLGIFPHTHWPE